MNFNFDRLKVAEREGFEPPVRLPVLRFSKPTHSTTLPSLRFEAAGSAERSEIENAPAHRLQKLGAAQGRYLVRIFTWFGRVFQHQTAGAQLI